MRYKKLRSVTALIFITVILFINQKNQYQNKPQQQQQQQQPINHKHVIDNHSKSIKLVHQRETLQHKCPKNKAWWDGSICWCDTGTNISFWEFSSTCSCFQSDILTTWISEEDRISYQRCSYNYNKEKWL
jgi:hypothetical protein